MHKERTKLMLIIARTLSIVLFSILSVSLSVAEGITADQKLNSQLQNELDRWRNLLQVPALSLSVSLPCETSTRVYVSGNTTINGKKKIISSSLFQIGSITKPFTAAIILQLEAEGKLSLNQTIASTVIKYGNWLPKEGYQRWKNVTIKQLLNMSSGIYNYTENQPYNDFIAKHPERIHSAEEILKVALSHNDYFKPGKSWHYSTTNYILLGLLIEKVTGHTVSYEMNHRFLGPSNYNLQNTYYLPGAYPSRYLRRMARGYDRNRKDVTEINMSFAGSAGAMVSTPEDITKWMRALLSGRVLKPKQMDELFATVPTKTDHEKDVGFSLGLFKKYYPEKTRGGLNWEYLGGTYGYLAYFSWTPSTDIVISLATSVGMGYQAKGEYANLEKDVSIYIPNSIYKIVMNSESCRKTHSFRVCKDQK